MLPELILKKGEEKRIRDGHVWIYSNEINTKLTPLKNFSPGDEVIVKTNRQATLGIAYINPYSLIAARLFTLDPTKRLDFAFIKQKIEIALALRTSLFDLPYYRLIFSEADELPGLIVDRFDWDFVVQINTAGMERKIEIISQVLISIFPDVHSILLRNESPIRKQENLNLYSKPLYGTPPDKIKVIENSISFIAPLQQGQKTGWFYDHRVNRACLKNYVKGKHVLDVFSYIGGFGIQAAVFGANKVDCIESSETACGFIKQNACLNQVEQKIQIFCNDAFDTMKKLLAESKKYDVIILDPPAFVKKLKDRKEGLLAYQRLNELALKLLEPSGILITCSCSMHVRLDDLLDLLKRIASHMKIHLQILERRYQGPDHPVPLVIQELDYLKAIFLRKR